MSKAEERALEKYPIEMYKEVGWSCVDKNAYKRQYFIEGYHQAEKDLALTWEDIKEICEIAFVEACWLERNMKSSLIYKEQHYQEVLKRFKERKEE